MRKHFERHALNNKKHLCLIRETQSAQLITRKRACVEREAKSIIYSHRRRAIVNRNFSAEYLKET